MAVYSVIQKSQLEGTKRLDAEYYQPEYLTLLDRVQNFPNKNLSGVAIIRSGTTPVDRDDSCKEGIILLKTTDIRNNTLHKENDYYFINEQIDSRMSKTRLLSADVLINIVGASLGVIGRVAFVPVNFPRTNITQAMALIRLEDSSFLPEFLFAFLISRYGRFQVDRLARPTGQFNLNLEELGTFRIPQIAKEQQQRIRKLVEDSEERLRLSQTLYAQAENLLLEELGLKDFKADEDLYSVVNFSEVKKANRVDAEYFQPKYEKLESKIQKYEHKLLGKVLENVPAKFDPMKQPDKSFKYVELSNINATIGIIDGFSEALGKETPSRAKRILKEKDVIVSSVEDSLGKVALVHKDQKDFLASTGFFQFRSKEVLPEVLLVLAKSVVFQWQLEKRCAGTILTAVPKESINDILIPVLPKPTQQKIAELVQKSHESRKKAKELLEEAKHKVEELIESS